MEFTEKKIDGEVIYDGKVLKLIKDKVLCPGDVVSYREIILHHGGAAILAINEDKKIFLVKQFRYAYNELLYEIPAGKLEKDEDPYDAAMRELEEETGNRADNLEYLGVIYPSCGYTSEKIHLYLATKFVKTHTNFDKDENIETYLFSLDEVKKMILNGEIKDAKTICAINYYMLKYEN